MLKGFYGGQMINFIYLLIFKVNKQRRNDFGIGKLAIKPGQSTIPAGLNVYNKFIVSSDNEFYADQQQLKLFPRSRSDNRQADVARLVGFDANQWDKYLA